MRFALLGNLAAGAILCGMSVLPAAALPDPAAPYAYMEEIEGARAMEFARSENARSLPRLQNDPRYRPLFDEALKAWAAKTSG